MNFTFAPVVPRDNLKINLMTVSFDGGATFNWQKRVDASCQFAAKGPLSAFDFGSSLDQLYNWVCYIWFRFGPGCIFFAQSYGQLWWNVRRFKTRLPQAVLQTHDQLYFSGRNCHTSLTPNGSVENPTAARGNCLYESWFVTVMKEFEIVVVKLMVHSPNWQGHGKSC